ncbi:hypothetical protein BGX38DRAFT_671988 [Terfezia claveryi]|nr:hypothetical protein BGX38DRAFT_671988 [Terfezia claveryi]
MRFVIGVLTVVPGKIGTVCGIYGGEQGCCPVGKNCNSVSGCQNSDDVYCETYCCAAGTTCAVDSTGEGTCSKGGTDDNDSQCDVGYSACTQFDGCCPTGTKCVLPKNCDIPCGSDDTICGTGCCQKGTYCTSEGTCAKDDTGSFTTLVLTTKTTDTIESTRLPPVDYSSETPTGYIPTETTDSSAPTGGSPDSSDSTSTTSTPTVPTITSPRTITTPATANAAPTMGAVLGGGLGMAAGIFGALAL